jgi:hypothetical protein
MATDELPPTGRDDLIPGFLVRRADDDRLEAHRVYPLDEILITYGCRDVVHAPCLAELELLCTAERVKEGLLRAAIRVATDTQPWRDPNTM